MAPPPLKNLRPITDNEERSGSMKNRIAFKLKCSVEYHVHTYVRSLGTKMDERIEHKIFINVYKLYNFENKRFISNRVIISNNGIKWIRSLWQSYLISIPFVCDLVSITFINSLCTIDRAKKALLKTLFLSSWIFLYNK